MVDRAIFEKAFKAIYTTDEGKRIVEIIEHLPSVKLVIPVNVVTYDIKIESDGKRFFFEGDVKKMIPSDFNINEECEFSNNYKIIEDEGVEFVISKEYENTNSYIDIMADSLKYYFTSFENNIPIGEKELGMFEALALMCENMIKARNSEVVVKKFEELNEIIKGAKIEKEFQEQLIIKQLEIYEAFIAKVTELDMKFQLVPVGKGA